MHTLSGWFWRFTWPDGRAETAEGTCGGRIASLPEGRGGFGFDPVFVAADLGRSLGRATPVELDFLQVEKI